MNKRQRNAFESLGSKSPVKGVLSKWRDGNRTFWVGTPDMVFEDVIDQIYDLLQQQWGFAAQMFSTLRRNRVTLLSWVEEDGKVMACQMLAWQMPLLVPEASFEARLLTFELANNALDPAYAGQNLDSWLVHILLDRGLPALVKKALKPETILIKRSEIVYGTQARVNNATLKYLLSLGKIMVRGVFDQSEEELRLRIESNLANTQYNARYNDDAKAMTDINDGTVIYTVNPGGTAMVQKILTAPVNGLRREETETFKFSGEGHKGLVQDWATRFNVFPEQDEPDYQLYVVSHEQASRFGSVLAQFTNAGFSVRNLFLESEAAAESVVEESLRTCPHQRTVFLMPPKVQNTQVWALRLPPMASESKI